MTETTPPPPAEAADILWSRSNAWRRTLSRRAGRRPRGLSLTCGRRDNLEISPNLWAGAGLVRGGAGAALVGDPRTVAERPKEFWGSASTLLLRAIRTLGNAIACRAGVSPAASAADDRS